MNSRAAVMFTVETGVGLLYAWYRERPANTRSWNSLKLFEQDLSFGRLTG
jgi:hypothetical protein